MGQRAQARQGAFGRCDRLFALTSLTLTRQTQTQRQRDAVLAAEADSHFAAGKFIQAAQAYAQSSTSFEEVVLRFVERDERDALRYYLGAKLERLKRTVRSPLSVTERRREADGD